MHGNAFEPIQLPARVWNRKESREILKKRDVAGLLTLAGKYAGASQVRISAATGIAQGRISQLIRGQRQVTDIEVYERIAAGLGLPDHARVLLGLAPLDIASPSGDHGYEHQEQAVELTARIEAAAAIDSTIVMILNTDTNNLRLLDRRLGSAAIADKMRAQITQIERAQRHAVKAVAGYQEALTLFEQLSEPYGQAYTLTRLGETQRAAGDRDAAYRAWLRALSILTELGHPDADTLRTKLHALELAPTHDVTPSR
ncbi:hypothetical protein ACQP2K_35145 [Microbispora siamensis]